MHSSPLLPVALIASLSFADSPLDPSRSHRIEAGFSISGHFGDITDEDEDFYSEVGLQVKAKDGSAEDVKASASGVGFSLAYWRLMDPKVELGAGYQFVNATERPEPEVKGEDGEDFFQRHTATLRARVLPLELGKLRIGAEAAAGYGFGTLRRYSLAASQVNLITSGISDPTTSSLVRSYILEANEPIGVHGPHFELHLIASKQITEAASFLFKLGYDISLWTLSDSDPLDSRVRKYPSSISNQGFGFQMGFGGSF